MGWGGEDMGVVTDPRHPTTKATSSPDAHSREKVVGSAGSARYVYGGGDGRDKLSD